MRKSLRVLSVIVSVCFLLGLIIQIVELRAFDRSFYEKEYALLETYDYIGISEADLLETTDVLLSYMEGDRKDMVVYATINGHEREVFNEREKLHMVDVVELIFYADAFKWIVVSSYLVMTFIYLSYGHYQEVGKSNLIAVGLLFVLLGVIGGYILVDFDSFWTTFHLIFFDNDLWLLNPYTDVMIQMFPLQFFYDIVTQIVIISVVAIALFAGVSIYLCRKEKVKG